MIRFVNLWTALTFSAGTSMIVAALVVWSHPWVAALLGLWAPFVFGLLALMSWRGKTEQEFYVSCGQQGSPQIIRGQANAWPLIISVQWFRLAAG